MKPIFIICFVLFTGFLQAQETKSTNFPPPSVPIEIKATKTNQKITIDGNLRLSWGYIPLSFIYLVYNDIQTDVFNPNTANTTIHQ